ncbi:alpha/beta hydrolase, partial [Klebsiella pneumoniae]|nr:alpha/beta hydrolase [Klebsiella pneumoniae]
FTDHGIKRFVLLHGRSANPQEAFFPWLKQQLEKQGFEVQIPVLPGGENPDDEAQTDFVQKNCTLDEHTMILGHSFGGVVAMR